MELFYFIVSGLIIGGAIFVWLKRLNVSAFLAVSLLGMLITLPIYPITYEIEKSNKEVFYEFWNGHEVEAVSSSIECVRDGSCKNTYSCDPYTVTRLETYTDSDGNLQTRTVSETHYHSCPYSNEETSWSVDTSFGSVPILSNAMTGTEFRTGKSIPGGQVTEPPAFWVEAKSRIDAGMPSGVTVKKKYKNFILSSNNTIFKQHEADIAEFLDEGLLPAPAKDIRDFYMVDRAYFAGISETLINTSDRESLTQAIQNLNGRSGTELTADVHVVFVDAGKVSPDLYTSTLQSYWVSPEHGRDAIAKNSFVVVFGIQPYKKTEEEIEIPDPGDSEDTASQEASMPVSEEISDDTAEEVVLLENGTPVVVWSRAFTGMPVGNEALIQSVNNLKGSPVDVQLIGMPYYDKDSGAYNGKSEGLLESMLFNGSTKYERVSMSSEDESDVGSGFKYLSESYVLSAGGNATIYWISTIIILISFGFAIYASMRYDGVDIIVSRDTAEKYFSSKTKKGN